MGAPTQASDLRGITLILRVLLGAYVACGIVQTLFALALLLGPLAWRLILFRAFPIRAMLTLASMALFFACAVAVLRWVYRAHFGLRERGVTELKYSPVWAVGSYLVPFVNFIVPSHAMRELWNRSHGEDVWQAESDVPQVNAWWSAFLIGNLVQTALAFIMLNNRLMPVKIVTAPTANLVMIVFSNVLLIGSAAGLFQITGRIAEAQRTLAGVASAFT